MSKLFQFCIVGIYFVTSATHAVTTSAPDEVGIQDLANITLEQAANGQGFGEWKDWADWKPPKDILKSFPFYQSGYDVDGLPVYVMEYGRWNYKQLAEQPLEKQKIFWKYFEQILRRLERDAAANNGQGILLIVDWNEFSLGSYTSSNALKLALQMFTAMRRFNNAIKYGLFLHTNFAADSFLNIARPFLGDILLKFEVYGTQIEKWKPKLLQKIPRDQLAPWYGGDENFKPVPFDG